MIERFGAMAALAFNSARQRELLRAQARTDSLTGMLNRRAYYERLVEELARGERTSAPVSVVLLDIDHFKPVNDELRACRGRPRPAGDRARSCRRPFAPTKPSPATAARSSRLIAAGAGSAAAVELAERARPPSPRSP